MESYEWMRKLTAEVLEQVVAGVKEAREAGVNALLPDIVAFELQVKGGEVRFEVPLEDEQDALARKASAWVADEWKDAKTITISGKIPAN